MASLRNNQWSWLEKSLAEIPPNKWKVAFFHRDLVRPQNDPESGTMQYKFDKFAKYLLPILLKHNVDVVFQGHAHQFTVIDWECTQDVEFCNPTIHGKKIRLYTTGGAGNLLRQSEPVTGESTGLNGYILNENTSHVIISEVKGDAMIIKAIRADGTVLHECTLSK
jgi:hypothetical protein